MYTGQNHWIVISTVGCANGEVDVFDSLRPTFTRSVQHQISAILATNKKHITVRYKVNVYYIKLLLY
jgi:hypothetical protein